MKKKVGIVLVLLLALCFISIGVKSFIDNSYNENIPILAYHIISDNPKNDMEVSTKNFKRQMKFLHNHGFKVMSLDDVEKFKRGEKRFKGRKVAITFDDGWGSYYSKAVPILEEYSFPSTNFIITGQIDKEEYLTSEQISELRKNKLVSLESHSKNLHNKKVAYSEDYQQYDEDFKENKEYNFKYYAYPFGIKNDEYVKALKNNDMKLAFRYAPSHWMNVNSDDYDLPRVPLYNSKSFYKFVLKVLIKR